ncbi:MAG: E3 ubiquitin ligase family protein [Candidatus Thiodiazotropha sp. (ex Monitilora ramsayi)]|nr:E3 ubiquitin ligase family protein [Candidatus Thiodiazotropha sp. (ex Monitilora ramsayi)]
MGDGAFWFWSALLALSAVLSLYYSFRNLHRARLIEDTPTSRIRSAHQGYVELIGEAAIMKGERILSPLSSTSCCWWRYKVERKNDKGWRTQRSGVSDSLFLLRDETGECIIDPEDAQVSPSEKNIWYGPNATPGAGPDRGMGTNQSNFRVMGVNISVHNTFGGDYRYTEETIMPGDPLYAIGLFKSVGEIDRQAMRDEMIKGRLRQWKTDHAALLEKFDRNRDGQIDLDEWEGVRRAATREVVREQMLEDQQSIHTLSGTESSRRPLLISTKEEFDIVRRFRRFAVGALLGFFVLGSLMVWLLTARFI